MKRKDCFLYFRFPLLPMLIPFPIMTKVINLASFLNFQRGEMHWGNVPSVLKNCTRIALKLISKKARKQKVLLSTEIWLQICRHCYVSNIYIAEYSWTSEITMLKRQWQILLLQSMPGTGLQVAALSPGAFLYAHFPPPTRLDTVPSRRIFSAVVLFIGITQNNLQKSNSYRIPQMLYIPRESSTVPVLLLWPTAVHSN